MESADDHAEAQRRAHAGESAQQEAQGSAIARTKRQGNRHAQTQHARQAYNGQARTHG
jgi:hypothetical protein